ncbi:KpsF/GutQ family sugar-phosphate isomerase [Fusibacter sp. JL298sf-3]
MTYTERIKASMRIERDAISEMLDNDGGDYEKVCAALMACDGKVVFMGVGKSGHIGKKLAATFSSTGTPSFFVHATEAVHGDLGMITKADAVILISNSGKTAEILSTLPTLRAIGCTTIALTAGKASPLAEGCDYKLVYPKLEEADHLNLAPTASSTMTLVLGDAIACALSQAKGFKKEDFHLYHPAGALGAKLKEEGDA